MSHLLVEIALRLSKILAALVVGLIVYAIATGPAGAAPSVELLLLSFLAAAAAILLVESSPL